MQQPSAHAASPADDARPLTPDQFRAQRAGDRRTRTVTLAAVAVGIVLLAALAVGVYALLQPSTPTDRIRDIFIIAMSLETLVIGAALVVLLVQLASLINLLQNEVKPILQATSETVNTLRGTADFLGESVVEPVIKLNSYLASIRRVLELMGIRPR
jgi:ABC-type dipeptide/oligopeptide/nickel transport system permease component